jgi:hypothetical protein
MLSRIFYIIKIEIKKIIINNTITANKIVSKMSPHDDSFSALGMLSGCSSVPSDVPATYGCGINVVWYRYG